MDFARLAFSISPSHALRWRSHTGVILRTISFGFYNVADLDFF